MPKKRSRGCGKNKRKKKRGSKKTKRVEIAGKK